MEVILSYTYETEIDATIDLVFDCLNKDEHVLKWNNHIIENIYHGTEEDLTEGSIYTTRQKLGKKVYEFDVKYIKYNPPNLVVIESETKEGLNRTEYQLEELAESTKISVKVYIEPANWFFKLALTIFKRTIEPVYDEQFNRFVDYVYEQASKYEK